MGSVVLRVISESQGSGALESPLGIHGTGGHVRE